MEESKKMKKASDILCVFAVLTVIFIDVLIFNGFFGYVESDVPKGILVALLLVIGVFLRLGLEDAHPVAAGVITLLFISTSGIGLVSAILLFCYAGQQNSVVHSASTGSSLGSSSPYYNTNKPLSTQYYERY